MHEYALARHIVEIAASYAKGAKVNTVSLVAGEDSGVLAESIKLYFDLIAEDTVCEGAVIEIETIKPLLRCKSCGAFFERKPFSFACSCGGEGAPTDIGREFYIKSIEVET